MLEACGFGFGLQRALSALGIECHVVCAQGLDERNKLVKTDGLDAKVLCLKLDRFVQGNQEALAVVPSSSITTRFSSSSLSTIHIRPRWYVDL
jgi:transposase